MLQDIIDYYKKIDSATTNSQCYRKKIMLQENVLQEIESATGCYELESL